jgi:hypothetical protein
MADALWIHGNVGQVERPIKFTEATPTTAGFQITAGVNQYGVIHFALPTPTIKNDIRAQVTAIHFHAEVSFGFISGVNLYDGKEHVTEFLTPQSSPTATFTTKFTLLPPHTVNDALDFAVGYGLGDDSTNAMPATVKTATLIIHAIGADYTYPDLPTDITPSKNPTAAANAQTQPNK